MPSASKSCSSEPASRFGPSASYGTARRSAATFEGVPAPGGPASAFRTAGGIWPHPVVCQSCRAPLSVNRPRGKGVPRPRGASIFMIHVDQRADAVCDLGRGVHAAHPSARPGPCRFRVRRGSFRHLVAGGLGLLDQISNFTRRPPAGMADLYWRRNLATRDIAIQARMRATEPLADLPGCQEAIKIVCGLNTVLQIRGLFAGLLLSLWFSHFLLASCGRMRAIALAKD